MPMHPMHPMHRFGFGKDETRPSLSPHVDSLVKVEFPARPIHSTPTIVFACWVHRSLPAPPDDVCPRVVFAWNMALADAMELT